jgi:hypothetical protein
MRQIEDCPELNLSNYDPDDVSRLNDWAVRADAEIDRLQDALREIALAGMSGTGMESEEAMRDWHARQAWKFIGVAARALSPAGVAACEPVADKITIRYERAGRCFWHIGCTAQRHAPPMRIGQDDTEKRRTAIHCTACNEAGYYSHGSVGEVCCERVASGVMAAPASEPERSPEDEARIAIMRDRFFDPKPGGRCLFDNLGGWPNQQKEAAKKLTLGAEYTVTKVEVHSAHTRIWLAGQGDGYDDWFNNMMFRPAPGVAVVDHQTFLEQTPTGHHVAQK